MSFKRGKFQYLHITTRVQWSKANVSMTKATMRAKSIKARHKVWTTNPDHVSLLRSLRIILMDQLKKSKIDKLKTRLFSLDSDVYMILETRLASLAKKSNFSSTNSDFYKPSSFRSQKRSNSCSTNSNV